MPNPKVLILRTAGTNCDYETDHAFQIAGGDTKLVHVNQLISRKVDLRDYQIMAIPGGFSYGDDIAAGILLANEIRYKLIDRVTKFVENGGLIIGICNGFQVLVRSGLLPDLNGLDRASLAVNRSAKFECRWVDLEPQKSHCVFTHGIDQPIYLPVAHAEGRFTANADLLNQLEQNGQIVFRYGGSEYPKNPNGADRDIAGICDRSGRIFGMMPHPERYISRYNHPRWTREDLPEVGDGLAIFRNAIRAISDL